MVPGVDSVYPLGWWGWFDQGKYLDSVQAFAAGDLSAARHWYPVGYPLLGAAFVRWMPLHPFVLVNLAGLLGAYAGFIAFCRRLRVGPGWAAAVFLASTVPNRTVFEMWVVPWNTTPLAALVWVLLACVARNLAGGGGSFTIGVLAGMVPAFRPTEALIAALCVGATLVRRQGVVRHAGLVALGAAGPVAVTIGLHLAIHGVRPSEYMLQSRELGFSLHALGWKAYTVLVEPRAWFLDGIGLLKPLPYLALAVPGLAVALAHGRPGRLLSVAIVAHTLLYLAYVDLLPVGLWRFGNVHYWAWALPGMGLLGFLAVRDVMRWRRAAWFPLAPLAVAASVPLLCVRAEPVAAAEGDPARMLSFAGPVPGFDAAYHTRSALRDAVGLMRPYAAFRAIPAPGGMRVFGIGRDIVGAVAWEPGVDGWQGREPPQRFRVAWRLGAPCWLRGVRCSTATNPALPPFSGP